MDQQKETGSDSPNECTKPCSRTKEHASRTSSGAAQRKYGAHSGIKFNFNLKKVTAVKPFSFDSCSKGTPSPSLDKCPEEQANAEQKTPKGVVSLVKKTEYLKVSKDSHKSSKTRSVSRERTQKSPVNDTPRDKKACTRCSREEKPSKTTTPQTSKAANSKVQASNTIKEKSCSKVAKPQKQSSSGIKPQVHFLEAAEPEAKYSNAEESHSSDAIKSESSNALATKSESETLNETKSESDSSTAEAAGSETSYGLRTNDESQLSDIESEPSSGSETKAESKPSNRNAEVLLPNGINLEAELSNATRIVETSVQKTASKIPRKTYGAHSGLKFHENFKKETIPQPFKFENRFKKETISKESIILTN